MKLFPGLLIASFMSAATIFAQTPAEETTAVLQAERDGCAAYLNGDAEKIANFLTEDYTLTNSKGEISARADDLADATSGKVHYTGFENYDEGASLWRFNSCRHRSHETKGRLQRQNDRQGCPVHRYAGQTKR